MIGTMRVELDPAGEGRYGPVPQEVRVLGVGGHSLDRGFLAARSLAAMGMTLLLGSIVGTWYANALMLDLTGLLLFIFGFYVR